MEFLNVVYFSKFFSNKSTKESWLEKNSRTVLLFVHEFIFIVEDKK